MLDLGAASTPTRREHRTSSPEVDFTRAEMQILREPLFQVPLDGAVASDICCTNQGRVFITTRGSSLYEIDYQGRSLFGRVCRKINHNKSLLSLVLPSFLSMTFGREEPLVQVVCDESRHILFTRSEANSIQVFDLGSNGLMMRNVAEMTGDDVKTAATTFEPNIDPVNFSPITAMCPIPMSDSRILHLMAVSHCGIRLYFSCNADDSFPLYGPAPRPSTLRLVHVRLPPGFSANSMLPRPRNVHMCQFSAGTTVLVQMTEGINDVLTVYSDNYFGVQPKMIETVSQISLCGRTWALTMLKNPSASSVQSLEVAREYLVFSAQGIHKFAKMRGIDFLRQILVDHGPESKQARAFFSATKADLACATCISLICSVWPLDKQLAALILRTVLLYGGQPTCSSLLFSQIEPVDTMPYISSRPSPRVVRKPDVPANFITLTSKCANETGPGNLQICFSSRHNGCYLYMSRLIGALLDRYLVRQRIMKDSYGKSIDVMDSALTVAELKALIRAIKAYHAFLKVDMFMPQPPEDIGDRLVRRNYVRGGNPSQRLQSTAAGGAWPRQEEVLQTFRMERQSLTFLTGFMRHCSEVLNFWLILCSHQFSVVISSLLPERQEFLKTCTLRTLVIDGREICSDLINCLISQYLEDRAATDIITHRLTSLCPSLFTSGDAAAAKAAELLGSLSDVQDAGRREQVLARVVDLYRSAADSINLPVICLRLEQFHNYAGVVELSLAAAHKIDPSNLGVQYLTQRETKGEIKEIQDLYFQRLSCYKCITDMFDRIINVPTAGFPMLPADSPSEQLDTWVRKCLTSKDEICHTAVFDWMIQRNFRDEILKVTSPFVEQYLHRKIAAYPQANEPYMDLLWKLLEMTRRYTSAAMLLIKLAEKESGKINLEERIQYLSKALVCLKSQPSGSVEQAELLQEAQDKFDVAQLQLTVANSLKSAPSVGFSCRDAVARLDQRLFSITELYEDYAEVYSLPVCKLAILHCGGHYDADLIESTWIEIIEKELDLVRRKSPLIQSELLLTKLSLILGQCTFSERYIPSDFLLKTLLSHAICTGYPVDWISKITDVLHVSQESLLTILSQKFKSKEPIVGCQEEAEVYIVECVIAVVNRFLLNPTVIPLASRPRFCSSCLDALSFYSVELHTKFQSSNTYALLLEQIEQLSSKLGAVQW